MNRTAKAILMHVEKVVEPATLTMSPTSSSSISASGATISITITSNTDWEIVTMSNCSISGMSVGSTGNGNRTLSVVVSSNSSTTSTKACKLEIKTSDNTISKSWTGTQLAATPTSYTYTFTANIQGDNMTMDGFQIVAANGEFTTFQIGGSYSNTHTLSSTYSYLSFKVSAVMGFLTIGSVTNATYNSGIAAWSTSGYAITITGSSSM